ncbi:GIY-YIG nuclease family protein [Sphingosinithalassobacter portus]|uniref:GIY-YIG nuclease family protein n=1 Tax=Stakelama portus TaxID=2676234 RepID=UPI000D6E2ED4|nr:GIY-YIG nuclease family protein [Sphingosinithalassobacter portus]
MTEEERIELGWKIGWVYFVQVGSGGHIKIGWAKDPTKRIASLQTAQPQQLKLLGVIPGSLKAEREVHALFSQARVRGEWFRRSDVIEDVQRLIMEKGFRVIEARRSRNNPEQKSDSRFNIVIPNS